MKRFCHGSDDFSGAAIRLDKRDGKSMEPLIRAGSMMAIDRDDPEFKKNKVYAVRREWGATINHLKREGDISIMIPRKLDRDAYPPQNILNA